MTDYLLDIDDDIRRAATPPAWLYRDAAVYERVRDRVLARGWHAFVGGKAPATAGEAVPWTLLEGCLDEPLVLLRDGAELRCLSNVCTHRGAVLIDEPCTLRAIRCPYHGRRFALDGGCLSMPHFEDVVGFPGPSDDLSRIAHGSLGPLGFASLAPDCTFDAWLGPLRDRAGWLPFEAAELDPGSSRRYLLEANWALYCDNYLEGFHIPYVHKALARTLELDSYRTELMPWGTLQIARAAEGEPALEPPPGHPDHGQRIAAYYAWLFPCTMLNLYPWGISVNAILPKAVDRSEIAYRSWVWDASLRERGAGAGLDRVELEDQHVVGLVQRGLRGRSYRRGRYSPSQERGVHHFHKLLARALA